jgi:FkbM family methyltransferase
MCNGGSSTLLDCGANAGQSAVSFLMGCPRGRVLSFEPNPLYQPVLAGLRGELGGERFEFFLEGLSDRDEAVELHVPFVDDKPYLQEAALDLAQFEKPWVVERFRSYGGSVRFEALTARFVTGDSRELDVDAVKIDAEGSELRVLSGLLETIRRCEPMFLIENNDWHRVTDFLGRLGYSCYRWDDAIGKLVPMFGASTNSFYLLERHREEFASLLN